MTDNHLKSAATTQQIDEFIIDDLETLKVVADPFRMRIMEYLRRPATVKQVAQKVNKLPTKLYYHFNLLEKHGLICTVDTRVVSGITEKVYQCAAKSYHVQRGLLSPGSDSFEESFDVTISGLFGDARSDLHDSIVAGVVATADDSPVYHQLLITQGRLHLTPERAAAFYARLNDLCTEFDVMTEEVDVNNEEIPYKLLLVLHPSVR